ncbi:hypothetical protein IWX49DRAFT_41645 [Phyllosticta citricarpa]
MHARAKVRRSARLDKMQRGDKERLGCWDRDRRGHYRTRDEGIKKLPVKQPACRHDGIWRERGKEQPWGTQEQTVSSEPYRSPNVPHAAIKHSKSCLECAAVQCWSTIALGGRLVTPGVPSPRPPTPRVQLQRVLYKTTHCHRNAARSSRPRCGPHGNTCGRVHMLVFPVFFFLSIFFFFFSLIYHRPCPFGLPRLLACEPLCRTLRPKGLDSTPVIPLRAIHPLVLRTSTYLGTYTPSPVEPRVAGPAVASLSVPLAWYSVGHRQSRGHLAACLSISVS